MSATAEPPQGAFRLSQLIYDTRYRSITIQVVALILLCAAFYWLINNTVQNLEALGKDFDFGFLGERAGYDINQMLIAYDNSMSHGRAALIGILNTLLVAFLGCVTATIIGVLVGVLRLSKNWVVSRLMAVYVEGFRNVPLLLWIVLIFALMTEATPQPRDFREGGSASMLLGDSVAVTNRGVFIPMPVWGEGTIALLVILVLSVVAAIAYRAYARKLLFDTGKLLPMFWPALAIAFLPVVCVFLLTANFFVGLAIIAALAVWLALTMLTFRTIYGLLGKTEMAKFIAAVPALIVAAAYYYLVLPQVGTLIVSSDPSTGADASQIVSNWNPWITLSYPVLGGFNFEDGIQIRSSLIALWFALSLYTGAFIAEIVRAGILSVSKGQSEAAFALGMRPNRTMNLVILPQALRVIIPPLISQFLNLTKNSSLAIAVGYMDVRATLGGITINQTGRELEGMLLLGMFYLALSLVISSLMNVYNNRTKLKER